MSIQKEKCPHAKKCGGCQLQNLNYTEQLSLKQRISIRNLGKFGHVEEIIGMENPYNYRNKVQAAFATKRDGKIVSGVYQSSTHNIVSVDKCQTEDIKADKIIVSIRKLLKDFKLTTYNEFTTRGFLRHVLVKRGFATGEIMVVLVTGTPVFTAKKHFVNELLKLHPDITTIIQNVNNKHTSMLLGENEKVLYGKGYIYDISCGCKFRISAKSFYQINPIQTEVLYGTAMKFAGLTGKEQVLDAYCGIGTIGLVASKNAGNVLGVEINKDAVKDAISNAKENNAKNIRFICADAGNVMVEMAEINEPCDVVFMDPPRAGSDEKFLSSLCKLSPKKVVYISCNPETQARDLEYLTKKGYKVTKIQPVDMFPHTNHIETVVLLSQQRPNDKIGVELKLDEIDLTSAEQKATYQEIKDYVLKEFDLKVSTIYISQIKKKCGLEVGKSYNTSKKDNQTIPQCPKDKENAIKAALKYFKMI
ncbi:MAG: 23S rRNA (uracil(1939)-C(5))-methyltransferase RlmD [Clostridia bacterium]